MSESSVQLQREVHAVDPSVLHPHIYSVVIYVITCFFWIGNIWTDTTGLTRLFVFVEI